MAEGTGITWWAVASAFGGTIIGGGISYWLARMNLKAAKKQRDEDRDEIRRALAYSLLFKMIRIMSDLHHMRTAVKEMFASAEQVGFKGEPWNIVMPVVPLPNAVSFSAEEMALVLSLDDKTFNEIASLDKIHASTVAIFDLYETKRVSVLERFGAEMRGPLGTTKLTREQAEWLAPRTVELNGIIEAAIERLDLDTKAAADGLKNLHKMFERELKLKKKLEFTN